MYTIIEGAGCHVELMIKAVQKMEGEGWRPIGGIAMTRDEDGHAVYAQAMTKAEQPNNSMPVYHCVIDRRFGSRAVVGLFGERHHAQRFADQYDGFEVEKVNDPGGSG